MNMMIDVNKFKLHDLSMSNYLTKCVGNSSEEIDPSYINQELESSNLNKNVDESHMCNVNSNLNNNESESPSYEIISPSINMNNINDNNINNINNNNINNQPNSNNV